MRNQRSKKKNNDKKNKRNGGNRNYTVRENFTLTFIEPHRYVRLRYCDNYNSTIAAATASSQVMNLNSAFDPDRTGTGHQPYGFDTMAALYNRYRVLKAHWRVSFTPGSLAYDVTVFPLNGLLSSSPTTASTFNTACEQQRSHVRSISPTGSSEGYRGSIDLIKLAGTTRTEYLADDRYEATVSASPAELMVLYVVWYNPNGSSTGTGFTLEFDLDIDFHDPISLAGS